MSGCSSSNYVSSVPIWETADVSVKDHFFNGSPLNCFGLEVSYCRFAYYIKNISKLPQSFDGLTFLVAEDGSIYQAEAEGLINESGSAISDRYQNFNPGEKAFREAAFNLPKGLVVTSMFKAKTATSPHIFDVNFTKPLTVP